MKLGMRISLSLFLVGHLLVVVLSPIAGTGPETRLPAVLKVYAEFMGLGATWNFFSPDPGPPPVFIEWSTEGSEGQFLSDGQWPGSVDPFFVRDRQNRRIAALQYMLSGESRAEKLLVPYLCRLDSQARAVSLWRVVHTIPTLEQIQIDSSVSGSRPSLAPERKWMSHTYCNENTSG